MKEPIKPALPVLGGVALEIGQYLPCGAEQLAAQKPSGGYACYDGKILTLHNYTYSGSGMRMEKADVGLFLPGATTICMEGENSLSIDALYQGVGILAQDGKVQIKGKGGLTLSVRNGEKGNTCIKSSDALELSGGTLRLTAGLPAFTVEDEKKIYAGISYAVDVKTFTHDGAKVTGADQKGGKVNRNDSEQAVYTFPKRIAWLPILLGLITIVALLIAYWAVFIREPVVTLAPDYAPQETEENAEPMEGGGVKREGNSVIVSYTDGITVDLSDRKVTLDYRHPYESTHDLLLQIVIQDTVIVQSGIVKPGYKLTTLDLLDDVQEEIVLSPGVYEGKFVLLFYDPDTGEKAMLNSEIPQKITVRE